jgi:hypothetical protein
MSKIQHEQAEQAVIQTASESGSSASILRATTPNIKPIKTKDMLTQTRNPKMAETGTQAWKPNQASVGIQSWKPDKKSVKTQAGETLGGAKIFDLALEDKIAEVSEYVQMEMDKDNEIKKRKKNIC